MLMPPVPMDEPSMRGKPSPLVMSPPSMPWPGMHLQNKEPFSFSGWEPRSGNSPVHRQ